MKRIAVYCGSSPGNSPSYADAARQLADTLVEQSIELVYGGASRGLMGVIADRVMQQGGKAIGIIPQSLLDREVAHGSISELIVVNSMHERKAAMMDMSQAFIAMPGGAGTVEEIIETFTWAQLQFHDKPCGVLNVDGYFDKLLEFFDGAVTEGFLREGHRGILLSDSDPTALLAKFREYSPPIVEKWVD